jgi:hypothetical protein
MKKEKDPAQNKLLKKRDRELIDEKADEYIQYAISMWKVPNSTIESAREMSLISQIGTLAGGIFFIYKGWDLWFTIIFMILGIFLGFGYFNVLVDMGLKNNYYQVQMKELDATKKTVKAKMDVMANLTSWDKKSVFQKLFDPEIKRMNFTNPWIIVDLVVPILFIVFNVALFLFRLSEGI